MELDLQLHHPTQKQVQPFALMILIRNWWTRVLPLMKKKASKLMVMFVM